MGMAELEVSKKEVLQDIVGINKGLKDTMKQEIEEYIWSARQDLNNSYNCIAEDIAEDRRILAENMIQQAQNVAKDLGIELYKQ